MRLIKSVCGPSNYELQSLAACRSTPATARMRPDLTGSLLLGAVGSRAPVLLLAGAEDVR